MAVKRKTEKAETVELVTGYLHKSGTRVTISAALAAKLGKRLSQTPPIRKEK